MRATAEELRANAKAGAEWLDEVRDGWWKEPDAPDGEPDGSGINLEWLQMKDFCFCICGQLEGHYSSFLREYQISEDRAVELGFSRPVILWGPERAGWDDRRAEAEEEWKVLEEAWRAEIRSRREKEGAST